MYSFFYIACISFDNRDYDIIIIRNFNNLEFNDYKIYLVLMILDFD